MLVVCPECKNEVSQYAELCPNCGFPIIKFMKDSNLTDTEKVEICPKCGRFSEGTPYYLKCDYCGNTMAQTDLTMDEWISVLMKKDAFSFVEDMANKYGNNQFSEEMFNARMGRNHSNSNVSKQKKEETNVPKCPTCGSTKIRKISGTKRAASILGFGILSNNIGKTYECLNCKYKW